MATIAEYVMAIGLMFTGVIFYSNILAEILDLMSDSIAEQEEI